MDFDSLEGGGVAHLEGGFDNLEGGFEFWRVDSILFTTQRQIHPPGFKSTFHIVKSTLQGVNSPSSDCQLHTPEGQISGLEHILDNCINPQYADL